MVAGDPYELMRRLNPGDSDGLSLYGRTFNDEVCQCLPGSLQQPRKESEISKLMGSSRWASGAAQRAIFDEELRKAEQKLEGPRRKLEAETASYDVAMQELIKKVRALDAAAAKLHDNYEQAKAAHVRGNCSEVVKKVARLQGSGLLPPRCNDDWHQVQEKRDAARQHAQPKCHAGASTLAPLRQLAVPLELTALPRGACCLVRNRGRGRGEEFL